MAFSDASITAYLLVSKRTQVKLLRELYRSIQLETCEVELIRSLGRTLHSTPEIQEYVESLYIWQTVSYEAHGYYKPFEDEDVADLILLLKSCRPKNVELHLFQTREDLLSNVRAERIQNLTLQVRQDGNDPPEADDLSSLLNPVPWLDIIQRSSNTLLTLQIGGKLAGAKIDYTKITKTPRCPRLISLRELLVGVGPRLTGEVGVLYMDLALTNATGLETLDLLPFEEAAADFIDLIDLPTIKTIWLPLESEKFNRMQAVFERLRSFSTLEHMRIHFLSPRNISDDILFWNLLHKALKENQFVNLKTFYSYLFGVFICPGKD